MTFKDELKILKYLKEIGGKGFNRANKEICEVSTKRFVQKKAA